MLARSQHSMAQHPYQLTLSYADQGCPDTLLRLEGGSELACHSAMLIVYSGILRDMLRALPIASGPEGNTWDIPLQDSTALWSQGLSIMYRALESAQLATITSWEEACTALCLAEKYDCPALGRMALAYAAANFARLPGTNCGSLGVLGWMHAAARSKHAALFEELTDGLLRRASPYRAVLLEALNKEPQTECVVQLLTRAFAELDQAEMARAEQKAELLAVQDKLMRSQDVVQRYRRAQSDIEAAALKEEGNEYCWALRAAIREAFEFSLYVYVS